MATAKVLRGALLFVPLLLCLVSAYRDVTVAGSRVIPLADLNEHIEDSRLPRHVAPTGYRLEIQAFPAEGHFMGRVKINITCREPTDVVFLHAHPELNIRPTGRITVTKITFRKAVAEVANATEGVSTSVKVLAIKRDPVKQWLMIRLAEKLKKARFYRMELLFDGNLRSNESEAFFHNSYQDHRTKERRWFVATQMKPTNARRVFPCFDEPAYKVPFEISVARPMSMHAISNMPVRNTEVIEENWVWDHFMRTPPLATFSVSILVSNLDRLPPFNVSHVNGNVSVHVIGRENFLGKLEGIAAIAKEAVESLQEKFDLAFPLPQLNLVALPHFGRRAPADQWGLVLFQERVLTGESGRWYLYNLLVTQWLGHLVTPHWWSDARLNQAIANYLATEHVMQSDSHEGWSTSVGYSVYEEFSQHKELAKQSDAAKTTKTEWLLRMLSKSLTQRTFQNGLQEFMRERQYDTYFEDDVWAALTKQAWEDKTLEEPVRVEDIARSWIYQDRFPVVTVTRNYDDNTAVVRQHTFLRGRSHDSAGGSDPLLWWIPVAFLTPDDLDLELDPSTPVKWVKAEREVTLMNLPGKDKFIIVNPDETGMFFVNYDAYHWSLLSQYLVSTGVDSSAMLPTEVRAKLLHDAWNLAFGGELSFGTALNMTLFLKTEMELPVWNAMFTMIDQMIGQIDGTLAAGKFKEYMTRQLASMYESLPPAEVEEEQHLSILREKTKSVLCSLGYGPCIDEAMAAYSQWIQSAAMDGTMISERYLCTIIQWNYSNEVESGLRSVASSESSPHTKSFDHAFLLSQLAKCLRDQTAIESLLKEVLLEAESGELNEREKRVILDQLTEKPAGYMALLNFVRGNWEALFTSFNKETDIWAHLFQKAATILKTNRGFNTFKQFCEEMKGEFGTDDATMREQLKMIKEAATWSNKILPDINAWLDNWMAGSMIQY